MSGKGGCNKNSPTKRMGIYEIRNTLNGKRYIGSAAQFGRRWSAHRSSLRAGTSSSTLLQFAWNKYGEDAFAFEIIEFVEDPLDLRVREQFYLSTQRPEYNICLESVTRAGLKNSTTHCARIRAAFQLPEAQAKLSARWKGKAQSDEHRAARAEAMRGNANGVGNVVTPEMRAVMNAGRAAALADGRIKVATPTPEHRSATAERMRAVHAAKSPEQRTAEAQARRAKQVAAGKIESPESLARRSNAMRDRMANMTPEEREEHSRKISEGKRRNPPTPEQRAAKSAAIKAALAAKGPRRPLTPEERAARSAATIAGKAARKAAKEQTGEG